jgi:hypothetical protein
MQPSHFKIYRTVIRNNRLFAKLRTGVLIYKLKFHGLYLSHYLAPSSLLHFHAALIRSTSCYCLGIF